MSLASTYIIALPDYPFDPGVLANFSADGHWLAWVSGNVFFDQTILHLKDLQTGQLEQISLPAGSFQPRQPVFSADGSKLAVRVKVSGNEQIQVYDLRTHQFQLGSSNADGIGNNGDGNASGTGSGIASKFSLSGDGRYLVFASNADNLVSNDHNGFFDIFVKDLQTGSIRLVSTNAGQESGNSGSNDPLISRDGHSVVFSSLATNFLGAAPDTLHLYIKDLLTGNLRYADTDANGNLVGASVLGPDPLFSQDGSKLLFKTFDTVYLKDLRTGSLQDLTHTGNGISAGVVLNALSADGRIITYSTDDVYQKDLQSGEITLLTPHGTRSFQTYGASAIGVSDDGQAVWFYNRNPTIFGDGHANGQSQIPTNPALYVSHPSGLSDNRGENALIGSSAADQLAGGNGNDSYWINHAGDAIVEAATGGYDLAYSLIQDYTLPANVEDLVLGDTVGASVPVVRNGSGNELNNHLSGNKDANILRGLGGDDLISGNGGGDTIDGGSGFDIVRYPGFYNVLDIGRGAGAQQFVLRHRFDATDTVQNVERIEFQDKGIALPGDTHAAQVYRVYQAAFNRTPDQDGLGFWIKQIDKGVQLTDIASGFIQSGEFKALYGAAPANPDLVNKFYQNVLHRAPDAGGLNFWVDALNSHRATPEQVLAQFAESPENQAALTGVIDAGFTFTLFK